MGAIQGLFLAQYKTLRKNGRSPSEAFNETVEEAKAALHADGLIVQGPLAGGHRATWDQRNESGDASLGELLTQIVPLGLPVIAAGGVRGPEDVDKQLASVGAKAFADRRAGLLSGGQQQLIRQAQAFSQDPELLLCDEPLLSLDPARARETVARLSEHPAAVVCVTHSINPVLGVVDRVLYIGPEGHVVGSVGEVMRSEVLSELYGTRVDVLEVDGRMVVL